MNVLPIELIAQQESLSQPATDLGIGSVLWDASGMVLVVLLVLAVASVASWFIIGYKALVLQRAERQSTVFIDRFWATRDLDEIETTAQNLPASPMGAVFLSGYDELRKVVDEHSRTDSHGLENVERAMRRENASQANGLERLLPFLATVGATAPFVGLFGTVWGIMNAFMEISLLQEAGIDVVAGPIAEALVATAIGLLAAIPAVIAYNFFANSAWRLQSNTDGFIADFLNLVRRNFVD